MSKNVDDKISWARLFMRKDRPLPKPGCSWAFYVFLALLVGYFVVMFIKYQKLQ